jgi:RNA polymerase sigma-70 factor (ECF subfamily)
VQPTDAAIIHASLEEPARFGEVFERHWDAVYGYAARRVGSAVGEDVAADAFLVAFTRRADFRQDATTARPWLLGIATNLLRHHLRDEQTHVRILASVTIDDAPAPPDDPERLRAIAALPIVSEVLLVLSPEDRDAFLLLALADLSYFEIARALDVPVGTVRSRIHRVRHRLRERLATSRAIAEQDEEW